MMIGFNFQYIPIKLAEGRPGLVEYHVSYSYAFESVVLRRKALKQFEYRLGNVRTFDGVVLFLPCILPEDVTVLCGAHPTNPNVELIVHVTFVKVKPLRDSITFLNILLRRIMLELGYVEVGRRFCDLNMIQTLEQHKLEVWPGWKVVVEDQDDGLMVSVHSCGTVLRTDTIYDFYRSIRGDPKEREKFNNFVLNKVVLVKYNHALYKIDDVAWDMTPASTFLYKTKMVSFAEYLQEHYNILVRDMGQPMLISKPKPKKNGGIKGGAVQSLSALVPECCFLTGFTEEQRRNFRVMNDVGLKLQLNPAQRVDELNTFMERLSGWLIFILFYHFKSNHHKSILTIPASEAAQEMLFQWNLVIEPKLIKVEGRRRDGPKLQFKNDDDPKHRIVANTDFRQMASSSVYCPVPIKRFAVIHLHHDTEQAQRFLDLYKHISQQLGIRMEQTGELIPIPQTGPQGYLKALQECRNKRVSHNVKKKAVGYYLTNIFEPSQVHFVVAIMPHQRDDVYGALKTFCLTDDPIPSQCVLSKNIFQTRNLISIVRNIALQINCKLGGSLWALKMPVAEKIMFVGIDCAHDPHKKDPSTVALVASMNNECTKYYSRTAKCKVHQEMADNLGIMMEDAMKYYWKSNAFFPDRIIVFRDGASVGTFHKQAKAEVQQLKVAQNVYAPKATFTFVLVAKKISQRFFLADKKGTRFDNPPPGTIVDSTVTRKSLCDFYLVSQKPRNGTVNPTHFVVLNPDENSRPDLLQKLAYVTTFMYFNWAGPIRVPAVVQYAHKLADLRSRYLKGQPHPDVCHTLYYL
ncbi:Protein argonaute-3 [Orchesella cincta]|uniref:Protein argonaute-3 n=1 Tax=Orchesella cincta TaxID=48709 RepID=A0A1D2MND0_ORCCI|nr:Protein argonaute-3 [Orchesella cincta]